MSLNDIAQVASQPMPVTFQGLSWTGAGVWTGVVLLIGYIVRVWPTLKKIQSESDASLRSDLLKRISELESVLNEQIRKCDEEQRILRQQIDGLQRMIVQFQVSSGRPLDLTALSEKATQSTAAHLEKREKPE